MNQELRIIRPEPNDVGMQWVGQASNEEERVFRTNVIGYNMMSRSQIGRAAFVVEQKEDQQKLRIQPPLTAVELKILSGIPYFRSILQEAIDG